MLNSPALVVVGSTHKWHGSDEILIHFDDSQNSILQTK